MKKWFFAMWIVVAPAMAMAQTVNTPMTPQTDTFTITFDVTPSVAPLNAGVGVSGIEVAAWGDMSSIIGFTPTGIIRTRNGAAYQQLEVMTYEAAKPYHVVMTVDVPGQTYSATITPDGGTEVVMAYEFGFRAAATEINNYFSHNDSIIAWGGVHDATLDISNFELLVDTVIDIDYGIQIGTVQNIPIPKQTGRFIAELNVLPSHDSMNSAFALSADTAAAWGDLSPIVRFGTQGKIDVRDGDTYTALTEYKYYKDRTYTLRMEVDVFTNTYNVSVTGDDKQTVLLAEGYQFRIPATELNFRVVNVDTITAWGGIPGSTLTITNFKLTHNPAMGKIYQTSELPVVDGDISDGFWDDVEAIACLNNMSKAVESDTDLSGYWKAVWTEDTLYVMANVVDDSLFDNGAPTWNTDGVHLHWGLMNNRNGIGTSANPTSDPADSSKLFGQYYYAADGSIASGGEVGAWIPGVTPLIVANDTGYVFEAKFPWSAIDRNSIGFSAEEGTKILFDVNLVDSDNDGWWSELQWSANQNNWSNLDDAGELELAVMIDVSTLVSVIDSITAIVNAAEAGYGPDHYRQEVLDIANAAIAAAQAIVENPESQTEVDEAVIALRNGMLLFVPNMYDYTELAAVIDSSTTVVAGAVIGTGDGEYSQESVDAANAAIAAAELILAGTDSQDAIDTGVSDLRAAMAMFVAVSVQDFLNSDFSMYPVPVNNLLHIRNVSNVDHISVYAITGNLMQEQVVVENDVILDLSELSSGMYIIKFRTDLGDSAKSIIKQ
ncbi:MAG: sugar-binding protein [Bacteroidota bacterium]